jgi:hypothetical protein
MAMADLEPPALPGPPCAAGLASARAGSAAEAPLAGGVAGRSCLRQICRHRREQRRDLGAGGRSRGGIGEGEREWREKERKRV